jgi:hypothetical protein
MDENFSLPPLNRKALISFLAASVAVLALCAGFLPLPLTAVLCYPPGLVLGGVSLVYGYQGLRELKQDGKRGRRLALLSMWAGGLMIVIAVCAIAVGVAVWPYVADFLNEVWNQIRR